MATEEPTPQSPGDASEESILKDLAADEVAKLTASIMSQPMWKPRMGPVCAAYHVALGGEPPTPQPQTSLEEEIRLAELEKTGKAPHADTSPTEAQAPEPEDAEAVDRLLKTVEQLSASSPTGKGDDRMHSGLILEIAAAVAAPAIAAGVYVLLTLAGL